MPHTMEHELILSRTIYYLARCHSGGMILKDFVRDDDVVLVVVVACQQLNRGANCIMFEPESLNLPFHAFIIPAFKAQS